MRRTLVERRWARPATTHLAGTGADLLRTRGQLLAENALLRQRLVVGRRNVKRPVMTTADRALLVSLAGHIRTRRQALLVVRPDTLPRWHRAGFRALWCRKSRSGPGRPPLPAETVALIRRMADENPRWGAERIRGERRKPGLRVAKRTTRTSLPATRAPRPRGQAWATFLKHHANAIRACDFLPITDLCFRSLFAYFVLALGSRRIVHVGVTRHPTDAWVAQLLREAPPFGDRHLRRVLREYVAYFNQERPHQGIGQATPERSPGAMRDTAAPVRAVRVPGGLQHTYQRAA